jgi:dolichyl-phosphate-mannose--protein O-mannosyl transferase
LTVLGTRRDIVAVLLITFVAGVIRVHHASLPPNLIFDEFYAADACRYIGHPASECRTDTELTIVHPPLGKWLIGAGIWLLGFREAGWRVASVVAGTFTVTALYILARTLLNSTLAATLASGLLAFDFLHFVLSRTAMLDIFVTFFIVVAFLCLAYYRTGLMSGRSHRGILALAGIAAGAAGASKWSAWPCLLVMICLTVAWEYSSQRREDPRTTVRRTIISAGPYLLLCLVVLPLVVYVVSYAGRLNGSLLTLPWTEDSWIRSFVERQRFMLEFHTRLSGLNPYTSPAWSWLLLKRPVLFYFRESSGDGLYQIMLSIGSPLVWWSSIVALVYLSLEWFKHHSLETAETIILAGFVACYGPWLLLGLTRQQVFNYYILPAVPFMCLALGTVGARLAVHRAGKVVVSAFAICSVALFLFYRPILVAQPISYSAWNARMLFRNCDQQPGEQLRPRTVPGPSPPGWCWP